MVSAATAVLASKKIIANLFDMLFGIYIVFMAFLWIFSCFYTRSEVCPFSNLIERLNWRRIYVNYFTRCRMDNAGRISTKMFCCLNILISLEKNNILQLRSNIIETGSRKYACWTENTIPYCKSYDMTNILLKIFAPCLYVIFW